MKTCQAPWPEGGIKMKMEVCSSFTLEAKAVGIGKGKK